MSANWDTHKDFQLSSYRYGTHQPAPTTPRAYRRRMTSKDDDGAGARVASVDEGEGNESMRQSLTRKAYLKFFYKTNFFYETPASRRGCGLWGIIMTPSPPPPPDRCPHCNKAHSSQSCTTCQTYSHLESPHWGKVLHQNPTASPRTRRRKRYLVDGGEQHSDQYCC